MRAPLAVIAFVVSVSAAAQEPSAVATFEQLVSRAVAASDKSTEVFFVTTGRKWARRYVAVADVKYDVRRTDSLVQPIVGQVAFTQVTLVSPRFDSKAEAETTRAIDQATPARFDAVVLNYVYRDRTWWFTTGEYESRFDKVAAPPLKVVVRELTGHQLPRLDPWTP